MRNILLGVAVAIFFLWLVWTLRKDSSAWEGRAVAALAQRDSLRHINDSLAKLKQKVIVQAKIHHDTVEIALAQLPLDTTTADSLKSCSLGFNACRAETAKLQQAATLDSLRIKGYADRVMTLEGLLEKRPRVHRFSLGGSVGCGAVLSRGRFYAGCPSGTAGVTFTLHF